jgi:hypothetical protein
MIDAARLWRRYGNHFSPYLLRRIDLLKKAARRQAIGAPALSRQVEIFA